MSSVPPPRPTVTVSERDPYRGVVAVLILASVVGSIAALYGGRLLSNQPLLDAAAALELSAGVLTGVLAAQFRRARAAKPNDGQRSVVAQPQSPDPSPAVADPNASSPAPAPEDGETAPETTNGTGRFENFLPSLSDARLRLEEWNRSLGVLDQVRFAVAAVSLASIWLVLRFRPLSLAPSIVAAAIAIAGCFVAAILAATAVRYLSAVDDSALPEARGLKRGARVLSWILVLAAVSVALQWAGRFTVVLAVHYAIAAINLSLAGSLLLLRTTGTDGDPVFPVEVAPLSVLGSRANIFAAVLDAAERQLGIDLRSTWALTVVRRGLEPLAVGLVLTGWLSTSLTVVDVESSGLVERLGVPLESPLLEPGLHLHFPWPIDRVDRVPARRVQAIGVGHEGEEAAGPENVLWSVEHAPNEFTLLLGNGRDLITVDAAVQYRIVDPRAWRYHTQNPAEALRALAYRAVMRNTVNLTLSQALSENVASLTRRMRTMVQEDADALGLGVDVIGFTVGGMHPPVAVAASYEGVVSAQISRVTAVVNAQADRNALLPEAEASVLASSNAARAEGAELFGRAAGEAWAFRALEAQYRAAPAEYFFRRRLEQLEKDLAGHPFTVVDARFIRDGGELWITP